MQKSDFQRAGKRGFVSSAARGAGVSVAIVLILFALFAVLVSSGRVPEDAMSLMTWISAFLGVFGGTIIAVKGHKQRALPMGIAVAAVLFMLTLLGAAFSEEGGIVGPLTFGIFAALIGGGILGSFVSTNRKTVKSRKNR